MGQCIGRSMTAELGVIVCEDGDFFGRFSIEADPVNPLRSTIRIRYSDSALPKQHSLTIHILIKILMFIWTDMIRFNIGKNTNIKNKTLTS